MAQYSKQRHGPGVDTAKPCPPVPDLRRLNYFFGQMLGVDDFRSGQNYFRDKHKLHNRCLHGYGTVCGLLVKPAAPEKPCKSEQDDVHAKLEAEIARIEKELKEGADWSQDKKDDASKRIEELKQELERLPKHCPLPPIRPRVLVECGVALDCHGNEIIVRRTETLDLWERLTREERLQLEHGRHDVYVSICFCEKPVS